MEYKSLFALCSKATGQFVGHGRYVKTGVQVLDTKGKAEGRIKTLGIESSAEVVEYRPLAPARTLEHGNTCVFSSGNNVWGVWDRDSVGRRLEISDGHGMAPPVVFTHEQVKQMFAFLGFMLKGQP